MKRALLIDALLISSMETPSAWIFDVSPEPSIADRPSIVYVSRSMLERFRSAGYWPELFGKP